MIKTMEALLAAAKRRGPRTAAVAAAQDADVLRAVCAAAELRLIRPLLVGDREEILKIGRDAGLPLEAEQILHEPDPDAACMRAAALVRDGGAELMMKGFVDTSRILHALLAPENGLRTGRQISHVLMMEVPGFDRLLCITDSAMNIAPTLEQKVSLIQNAAGVLRSLGCACPKAAALCAVEKEDPKMPCTLEAAALAEMSRRGEIPGCIVDGPLALDNAVSPEAARHKGIRGPVAGCADILLVPDIEAGNLLNKSMEYFAHAKKAGVIVGARAPVVLTSRATAPRSKLYSIALGVLIAAGQKEGSA